MGYKNIDQQREYQRIWARKRREEYVAKFGGRCEECGSTERLEFDHRDMRTKVSHRVWGWSTERLEEELAKCRLVCSACHLKKTLVERYATPEHGTYNMYKKYRCRCEPCRQANTEARRGERARAEMRTIAPVR